MISSYSFDVMNIFAPLQLSSLYIFHTHSIQYIYYVFVYMYTYVYNNNIITILYCHWHIASMHCKCTARKREHIKRERMQFACDLNIQHYLLSFLASSVSLCLQHVCMDILIYLLYYIIEEKFISLIFIINHKGKIDIVLIY